MARYRVQVEKTAERQIRRLPGHVRQRVRRAISSLADVPRPRAAIELRGHPGYYRIRINGWRIVYLVEDEVLIVVVIAVPRKSGPETYKSVLD